MITVVVAGLIGAIIVIGLRDRPTPEPIPVRVDIRRPVRRR